MKEIYEYLLKNSTFDNLIKNYIDGNRIVIIRNDENTDYIFKYLKEYVLNNATIEDIKNKCKDLNANDTLDFIKVKKLTLLNREINNNKRNIINIFLTFIEKDDLGRSLNDLYSITKKCLEFKDEAFKFFSILSKCEEVIKNEEELIVDEINKITTGNYINIYIKYLKFRDNKKFEIIKDNIDMSDIKKIITKLSGILNNSFAFMPPIYNNEYTSDFENEEIYYKNYTPEQLLNEVKKINYKHNKKLLEDLVDIKWYKFSQILNYKKITNKNKEVNNDYYEKEKEIYNQYMENIENLKLFSSSFKFLTKVFKEKVLDEINDNIANEDNLYEYILNIKETLTTYEEFLTLENKVKSLSDIQKNILDYCYDKIDEKKDLEKIIKFIPSYYLYQEIEKNELKYETEIIEYEFVDERIRNLHLALKSYDNIILQVLKEYSYKNTNDYIKENKVDINKLDFRQIIDNKYEEKNYKFLSNLYPFLIINEEEYEKNKDSINDNFQVIIKSTDFLSCDDSKEYKSELSSNEKMDNGITNLLSNLGYHIYGDEKDKSLLYVSGCKGKDEIKTIFINNKEKFTVNTLIRLLDIIDKRGELIYIWYRNWWLNKNEEVQRLHFLLNR
ncbi:hypothetical protein [Clostridium sp. 1001271B_151109_B4]|uniref:hypothetical protein n=1 Tax=Clostridium sp. 1001271B_151109_B4 TaxID=2787148 RepID=UPI0018ABF401|nr:hypothetical protein [Clostridium sp. 1001271B_151109_B4]